MKYIDFHKKSIQTGLMVQNYDVACSTSALCDAFKHRYDFQLLRPTDEDRQQLIDEGKSAYCWGSDHTSERFYQYTTLRQNIVLLLACMAGEL